MGDKHNEDDATTGLFTKSDTYRKTCEDCGRGYHGNRWDAHHILPGTVFTETLKDDPIGFIETCLNATDYDINKVYSLGGLPKLTAFILFFQTDKTMPFKASREKQVTMLRWGHVDQYETDKKRGQAIAFPGNYPVHNPPNWGHTQYNDDVLNKLDKEVFNALREKKDKKKHYDPEDLKEKITKVKDSAWSKLVRRASGVGCGAHRGIEANLRHRYDDDNDGWWKPLCMADVPEPASP